MNPTMRRRSALLGLGFMTGLLILHCAPRPRQAVSAGARGAEAVADAPASPTPIVPDSNQEHPKLEEKVAELEREASRKNGSPPLERPLGKLDRFYDIMEALRAGARKEPARVLWLGDSHTAADFLTHEVREHLQDLAGDAGPGFVRLGLDGYRHGAVRVTNTGRWRKQPILPAQRTRVLDGVFGYGGIRTIPDAFGRSRVELRAPPGEAAVEWTVRYRLQPGAGLRLSVGKQKQVVRQETGAEDAEVRIGSTTLTGEPSDDLTISHYSGVPQVFGVSVEYNRPGVVFDTVGINGARAATVLAWRPEAYIQEISERIPDLLVLAFGTNEVFDNGREDRYEGHLLEIVERVRESAPETDCWIVGPPDSATPQGGTKPRVVSVTEAQRRAAEKAGCAFTSQWALMGGEGSFYRWMQERPAKARSDRIHLTIAGYRTLGEKLAHALVPEVAAVDPAGPRE